MSLNLSAEIKQAIRIAWDPSSSPTDKSQAIEFITQIRSDPSCWKACLQLFVEEARDRTDATASDVLRHFCLEAVNFTVRQPSTDAQVLQQITATLFEYVLTAYTLSTVQATGVVDTPHIQNKLSEVFTGLFVALYSTSLPEFFRQFRTLACGADVVGADGASSFNPHGAFFFLRVLISIHDEIADILIIRSPSVAALHARLKDQIRERDMNTVVELWSTVLSQWEQLSGDISDACLKSISRWVQWTELSLVVKNRQIMSALCMIVNPNFLPPGPVSGSEMMASRTKLLYTAVDTFTGIVSKKSPPEKKIELIHTLDLTNLIALLVQSRQLSEFQGTEHYDNDLAENVAKLVNAVMSDLVYILDSKGADSIPPPTLEAARSLVVEYLPFLLRFLSDQYDSVSHTVIGATTYLVTWYRKTAEKSTPQAFEQELASIMRSTIAKIQYDSSIDEDDDLEETEEAFTDLRKKLSILQKMIADTHRPLFVSTVNGLIDERFNQYKIDQSRLTWRDIEVALYEMTQFAEVYPRIGSVVGPDGQRGQPMADEVMKRIAAMIEIDISSYPNTTTQLLYLDICIKFLSIFEVQPELIQPALGAIIRLSHSTTTKVRRKAWWTVSRFVAANIGQHLRPIAKAVMVSLEDLLVINANVSDVLNDEAVSEEDRLLDEEFKAQLHLFETVSSLLALLRADPADFVSTTQAILGAICTAINSKMETAKSGGTTNDLLAIHHNIMALGTVAHKLGALQANNFDQDMARVFEGPSNTVLSALLNLNNNKSVRYASRFALTRLIDVQRSLAAPQLDSWLSGLLGPQVSVSELAQFLPVMSQMIYLLRRDMKPILESKLPFIVTQVLSMLNSPVTGTDDHIQLVELQREFFTFILYFLGHGMAGVFSTEGNNQTFQNVILYLQTVAKGETGHGSVGLAFKAINKILGVYGGPGDVLDDDKVAEFGIMQPPFANDIRKAKLGIMNGNSGMAGKMNMTAGAAEPVSPYAIPQFVDFVIDLFHPLVWIVPTNAGFKTHDTEGKEIVKEILLLQVLLTQKSGEAFLRRMMADLSSIPMFGKESVSEYLGQLYYAAMGRLARAPGSGMGDIVGLSSSGNGPAAGSGATEMNGTGAAASASTTGSGVPFAADPDIKKFRKYFEGVVAHIRQQKGL